MTARGSQGTSLNQVLFINDKINTGLLAKSNITNKNQPIVYAIGHEMFHSLRITEPNTYNSFVEYVANTITNDQILRFMEMYDPQDTQGLLKGMQIDGKFNLEEILANPKKYQSQYQSLLDISEEMVANEFGGMFTDVEYMTNLANKNKSLFKKVVNAIKKFFKDIDRPIYNSTLTQYQISTIRQNFEDIINEVNQSEQQSDMQEQQKNVANSQEMVYNTPQKEEGYNEFEQLQRESERLSNEEQQLYRSGRKQIDDDLRGRLSRVFEQQLESSRSSNSDDARILTDNTSGNSFEVYENVDAQTFHDIFEIVRKYTKNGELVDVHPAISTEEETGYDATRNYITKDGLSGFAITKDGDLISVFNANNKRGWLRAISDIVKSDAKTLDCYVSYKQDLQEMYQRVFGFKTASIMDYNMEYDHDDIAKNHKKPKVAFMVNTDQDVQTKSFGKDEYDEAKAYQMSFFDENGGKQDTGIEKSLDGLENSVKKPKSTRQKLEKITKQVTKEEEKTQTVNQSARQKETSKTIEISKVKEELSNNYYKFLNTDKPSIESVKNIRNLYDNYLKLGGKESDYPALTQNLDLIEKSLTKSVVQKEQKVERITQQVNTSEQVAEPTRQTPDERWDYLKQTKSENYEKDSDIINNSEDIFEDDGPGQYQDTTQEELNSMPVALNIFSQYGNTSYIYKNKNALLKDVQNS